MGLGGLAVSLAVTGDANASLGTGGTHLGKEVVLVIVVLDFLCTLVVFGRVVTDIEVAIVSLGVALGLSLVGVLAVSLAVAGDADSALSTGGAHLGKEVVLVIIVLDILCTLVIRGGVVSDL